MDFAVSATTLRIIIAAIGVVVLVAIYFFGRPRKTEHGRRVAPRKASDERVDPVIGDTTDADGIAQLRAIVRDAGYTVQPVPIRGCLHLKSAVTDVADDVVLINPEWVDRASFAAFRQIEIDAGEPHAANALRIGDGVIYPASFPRTLRRLESAGVAPLPVDVSELQKAEGAVTCCSLVFSGALA